MQAVRAGQPESSHSPLLHQGIHAAHVQLHHQAAEANEDENSAVQAALTADDMQEEAFRAAAHAGKAQAAQCPLAAETRHPAGVCSRKIFPQASQSHCPRTESSSKCSSQSRKHQETAATDVRPPSDGLGGACAGGAAPCGDEQPAILYAAGAVGAGIHRDWHLSGGGSGRKSGGKRVCRHGKAAQRGNEQLCPQSSGI